MKASPRDLSAAFIRGQRLRAQQLIQPTQSRPEGLLTWMGALQAQDRPASLRALNLRLAQPLDLEAAVARKRIVRSWVPRGTLHWCAATDLRWMLGLLAPRLMQRSQTRLRQLGLSAAQLDRGHKALTRALAGGKVLARDQALQAIEAAGVSIEGQRGYHLLQQAGLAGLICFGPMQGKQAGFVLAETWLPKAPKLSRDAALRRLAWAYFRSRGPASVSDFVWWSGLAMAEARAALAMLQAELQSGLWHGKALHWAPMSGLPSAQGAWLLPAFDEWLLAYADRSAVLDPRHAQAVVPGSNGMFLPILVLDGEVRGLWERPTVVGAAPQLLPFKALPTAARSRLRAAWSS